MLAIFRATIYTVIHWHVENPVTLAGRAPVSLSMKNVFSDLFKRLWIVLVEAISSFRRNKDLTSASSLAFSATLALIPALFLLTTLLGFAIGSSEQALLKTQEMVKELIPRYSQEILREVGFITTNTKAIGIVNIVVLLWIITPLVSGMRLALSSIFRTDPDRSYVLGKVLDISITIVFVIGISGVAVMGVVFALVQKLSPLRFIPRYLEGIVPFFFVTTVVVVFYLIFYSRVPFRRLLIGAVVTTLLWFAMRPAFNLFLTYNPGYGFTFGSFKSLFVIVIWIYYSLSVFLFGAEIASSLNREEILSIKRLMEGKGGVSGTALANFAVPYEKGRVIFTEGDAGKEMFFVLKGSVGIRKDGREIAVLREKNFFGEMSFLLAQPRSATSVALDDVELLAISNDTIVTLMNEFPELVFTMMKEMAVRLRETSRLIT
jgi:membrane protein